MPKIALPSEPATRFTAQTRSHRNQRRDPGYPQPAASFETMPAGTPDLFDLLAESVRMRTGAIGAAVALTAGAQMRCCGSAGNAPPKGIAVSTESTLVGECVRTGQIIGQYDAVSNGTSAASVLLAPVDRHGAVIGVLGLFWRDPHAISDTNMAIARAAATMISATLDTTSTTAHYSPERIALQLDAPEAEAARNIPDGAQSMAAPAHNAGGASHKTDEPAVAPPLASVSKPLGITKKLYGLPCPKCGCYSFSDETSCPICCARNE